jgi:predicted dinucleotide-binding enzyme
VDQAAWTISLTAQDTGEGRTLKIGIIGTGRMGRALGLRWAANGHNVLFGSRDLDKATSVAASNAGSAQAGDFDTAAAFGDVVLYTVREPLPSKLLRAPEALTGKIMIDCNNSVMWGLETPDPEGRPGLHFPTPIPSLAEKLAADVPKALVVKAFNTIPHVVIGMEREMLAPHRVSVFLCSDHPSAKAVVKDLADELGFVGVDSGELERAQLVESVADFTRFQIVSMGLGFFTTISVNVLPTP